MFRIKQIHLLSVAALTVCFLATPCHSEVIAAVPENADEYERIFGHEAIASELTSIQEAVAGAHVPITSLNSLQQYSERARRGTGLLILVGHNGRGEFKFLSGESVKLEELARIARDANRIGVFLTCNGALYTNSPAPRLRTTFKDAFVLAGEIENRFRNSSLSPRSSPVASMHNFSSIPLSTRKCVELFAKANVTGSLTNYQSISKEIQRTIFRAEASKVVLSTAKAGLGISVPGVMVYTLEDPK
jgi:hypothetical protein